MRADAGRRMGGGAILLSALGLNAVLVVLTARSSVALALGFAALPFAAVLLAVFVASSASCLLYLALGLGITAEPLNRPLPVAGGNLYTADVIAVLALATAAFAAVVGRRESSSQRVVSPPGALRLPFLVFALVIAVGTVRGHYAYGVSLLGSSARLVIYAAIAGATRGLTPRTVYRGVVVLFYAGTVWILLNAAFYIATGTSQTAAEELSTGGRRILSLSVAMYMAAALFLALLSLQNATRAGVRLLHATMALLALVGVVLGFGRGVFAGVAVVVPLLLLRPRQRRAVAEVVPLLLPLLAIGAILVPRFAPDIVSTFVSRVTSAPTRDANVDWRKSATEAIWPQVRQSPLVGVGFGKGGEFTVYTVSSSGLKYTQRAYTSQDPHDSYVYLLAGGGILALGSFLAVCLAYAIDLRRRLRGAVDASERVLLLWSASTAFVFLLNGVSAPIFDTPSDMLALWALLVIPGVVPLRPRPAAVEAWQARVRRQLPPRAI